MNRSILVQARWDDEAAVWIATSAGGPGLVIEAPTRAGMIGETRPVIPDLLDL